jgi:hypothetical protein
MVQRGSVLDGSVLDYAEENLAEPPPLTISTDEKDPPTPEHNISMGVLRKFGIWQQYGSSQLDAASWKRIVLEDISFIAAHWAEFRASGDGSGPDTEKGKGRGEDRRRTLHKSAPVLSPPHIHRTRPPQPHTGYQPSSCPPGARHRCPPARARRVQRDAPRAGRPPLWADDLVLPCACADDDAYPA